jgi:hypothetical protein
MPNDPTLIYLSILLIHFIAIVAYASRIAGGLTGRIALAGVLMNLMFILSRTANAFYAPMLSKQVESAIGIVSEQDVILMLRETLFMGFVGGALGYMLIRYFIVFFIDGVNHAAQFSLRSMCWVALRKLFSWTYWKKAKVNSDNGHTCRIPYSVGIAIFMVHAIWAVGFVAPLYAGFLVPEYRATVVHMSAFVNGFATILMFVYCDPYFAAIIDKCRDGDDRAKRSIYVLKVAALLHVGALLFAQLLIVPCAMILILLTQWL